MNDPIMLQTSIAHFFSWTSTTLTISVDINKGGIVATIVENTKSNFRKIIFLRKLHVRVSFQRTSPKVSYDRIFQRTEMKYFVLMVGLLAISTEVNNTDVNAADMGYSPFSILGENSSNDKNIIAIASLASAYASLVLIEPCALILGVSAASSAPALLVSAISGILASAMIVYASRNNIHPDALYQKVWGKIETQVNTAINSKYTSTLKDHLATLSQNLHDESTSYLAQIGVTNVTDMIRQGNGHIVSPKNVDLGMKAIDDILSASNSWISAQRVNYQNPDAFVLVNAQDSGVSRCLHTRNSLIVDGTDLVVDSQCNMNSLDGKLFAIDNNGSLILRTSFGDKCVTFKRSFWSRSYNYPLAIFPIGSKHCISGKRIKLQQIQAGFSLFEGAKRICISKGTGIERLDSLVSAQDVKMCQAGKLLSFKSRLPVTLAPGSLVPAQSFDEIGVQIFYFPTFASYHLTALKEMYLHGASKNYAKAQFQTKLAEYKLFLSDYLPVFAQYANYTGVRADQQVREAGSFAAVLRTATLSFTAQKIEFLK